MSNPATSILVHDLELIKPVFKIVKEINKELKKRNKDERFYRELFCNFAYVLNNMLVLRNGVNIYQSRRILNDKLPEYIQLRKKISNIKKNLLDIHKNYPYEKSTEKYFTAYLKFIFSSALNFYNILDKIPNPNGGKVEDDIVDDLND